MMKRISLCFVLAAALFGNCNAVIADMQVAGVEPKFLELIARCAPTVHSETMAALISAESRGHQFAIADAGPVKLPWAERKKLVRSYFMDSLEAAVLKTKTLIENGHTVSLGFTQLNDRNLPSLGLSIEDAFDACKNIGAGGKILTKSYLAAVEEYGPGEKALDAALSAYESGNWKSGQLDGYVGLVKSQRGIPLRIRSKEGLIQTTLPAKTARKKSGRTFTMTASNFSTDVDETTEE